MDLNHLKILIFIIALCIDTGLFSQQFDSYEVLFRFEAFNSKRILDLNEDGQLDIVAIPDGHILEVDGEITVSNELVFGFAPATCTNFSGINEMCEYFSIDPEDDFFGYIISINDFDGNGFDDILTNKDIYLFQEDFINQNPVYNKHDFENNIMHDFPGVTNPSTEISQMADLDGNGLLDVIAKRSTFQDGRLFVFTHNTVGEFEEKLLTSGQDILQFYVCDFEGDGDLDIVFRGSRLSLFNQQDDGSFIEEVLIEDMDIETFGCFDMEGDGDMDFVGVYENKVLLFENADSEVIFHSEISDQIHWNNLILIADIDNDGLEDIITSEGQFGQTVKYYRSLSYGGAEFVQDLGELAEFESYFTFQDYENDGDLDIVGISGSWSSTTSVNFPVLYRNHIPLPTADFEHGECDFTFRNRSFINYYDSFVEWDFGNGDSSNEIHPDYHYKEPGTYIVSLTVCDSNGNCDSKISELDIEYSLDYSIPCTGESGVEVDFNVDFTGYNDVSWNFGDTISYKGSSISHSFEEPGIYDVELVLDDSEMHSCEVVIKKTINITGIEASIGNISEFTETAKIAIHPNPSNGLVSFSFPFIEEGNIQIINLNGNPAKRFTLINTDQFSTDISDLKPGLYFIAIFVGNEMLLRKSFAKVP